MNNYKIISEKSGREKQLETIIIQLFNTHFFGTGLEWSYNEGKSLLDIDRELYIQILTNVPEVLNDK